MELLHCWCVISLWQYIWVLPRAIYTDKTIKYVCKWHNYTIMQDIITMYTQENKTQKLATKFVSCKNCDHVNNIIGYTRSQKHTCQVSLFRRGLPFLTPSPSLTFISFLEEENSLFFYLISYLWFFPLKEEIVGIFQWKCIV